MIEFLGKVFFSSYYFTVSKFAVPEYGMPRTVSRTGNWVDGVFFYIVFLIFPVILLVGLYKLLVVYKSKKEKNE